MISRIVIIGFITVMGCSTNEQELEEGDFCECDDGFCVQVSGAVLDRTNGCVSPDLSEVACIYTERQTLVLSCYYRESDNIVVNASTGLPLEKAGFEKCSEDLLVPPNEHVPICE